MAVVDQYLARLEKAFGHVPSAERDELVEEVRGHVLERLEAAPHVTEQVVNEILRAVGDPGNSLRNTRRRRCSAKRSQADRRGRCCAAPCGGPGRASWA
jgi:hypothetical protein